MLVKVSTMDLYKVEECWMELPVEDRCMKLGEYDNDDGVFIKRYPVWSFGKSCPSLTVINFILYRLKFIKTEIGHIFRNSPNSLRMYRGLFREIREADIVHLHTLPYFHNIAGYFIARIYGKKIVITPHFHPGHKEYEKKILFRIMDKCDAVITVSKYEKDYLEKKGVSPEKIFVTGNALLKEKPGDPGLFDTARRDLFKKYTVSADSKKILFLGRKEPYKGIEYLIKAAKELAIKDNVRISLLLAGPDTAAFKINYQDYLKGASGKLTITDFGTVSDIEKEILLETCDVLALPSEYEAFGIVFLEAWRYGKPVVGSNIGAVPDVIKGAGLCAEYGNVRDLKDKIKLLLYDRKLAAALGREGKRKVKEEYSLENIGAKVFHIYKNLNNYKKRILVVSNFFPPYCEGGAEIAAYEQVRSLKNTGFDISIFSGKIDNKKPRYSMSVEKKDFNIMRANFHAADFSEDIAYIKNDILQESFRNRLYDIAPDIVHFHNIDGFCLGMIEDCGRLSIPMVMTLHDYWHLCFKKTLLKEDGILCETGKRECLGCRGEKSPKDGNLMPGSERDRLFMEYLGKIDLLISPSNYLAERFINSGVSRDKMRVINNGIDITRFGNTKKRRSAKMRFGFAGTIRRHKGVENLLKALFLLKQRGKVKFSLTIAGKGEDLFIDYFKRIIRESGLKDHVRLLGEVDNKDMKRFYENIDVLVVPSIWPENSPVTIMEALASGTPVLASDIGGIPELVQDGTHGYLHKHDDISSLMENMKKMMDSAPDEIEAMRKACLERAREFNMTRQAGLIASEYNRLMG
jgi:glycosyltransferase involved in cell wall biosynthesis